MDRSEALREALLSAATLLPEFDEVAAMYERDPERDPAAPMREQADHVSRMALLLWGVRRGRRTDSLPIEVYAMTEYPDSTLEDRLFIRRYNGLLSKLASEDAALHPERAVMTGQQCRDIARSALQLTRATMPRRRVG